MPFMTSEFLKKMLSSYSLQWYFWVWALSANTSSPNTSLPNVQVCLIPQFAQSIAQYRKPRRVRLQDRLGLVWLGQVSNKHMHWGNLSLGELALGKLDWVNLDWAKDPSIGISHWGILLPYKTQCLHPWLCQSICGNGHRSVAR